MMENRSHLRIVREWVLAEAARKLSYIAPLKNLNSETLIERYSQ
jgi:hypothetical protein